MFVKIHRGSRDVIAICDSDLIGKKFEEGIMQLDVKEEFFKGDEMDKPAVVQLCELGVANDASFNVVGQEAVSVAIEAGIFDKKDVRGIERIPVGMVLL